MSITGSLIIFVLIWWIIFFSLLPIDVDRKHKEIVEGADKGSPENPKIIKKIIYTTIITSIISLCFLSTSIGNNEKKIIHQINTKIMSEPVILILYIY